MTFTNAAVASGGLCGNPNSRGTLLTVRPGPSAREGPRVVPARRTAFLVPKATFWKRIFQSPGDEGQEAGSPAADGEERVTAKNVAVNGMYNALKAAAWSVDALGSVAVSQATQAKAEFDEADRLRQEQERLNREASMADPVADKAFMAMLQRATPRLTSAVTWEEIESRFSQEGAFQAVPEGRRGVLLRAFVAALAEFEAEQAVVEAKKDLLAQLERVEGVSRFSTWEDVRGKVKPDKLLPAEEVERLFVDFRSGLKPRDIQHRPKPGGALVDPPALKDSPGGDAIQRARSPEARREAGPVDGPGVNGRGPALLGGGAAAPSFSQPAPRTASPAMEGVRSPSPERVALPVACRSPSHALDPSTYMLLERAGSTFLDTTELCFLTQEGLPTEEDSSDAGAVPDAGALAEPQWTGPGVATPWGASAEDGAIEQPARSSLDLFESLREVAADARSLPKVVRSLAADAGWSWPDALAQVFQNDPAFRPFVDNAGIAAPLAADSLGVAEEATADGPSGATSAAAVTEGFAVLPLLPRVVPSVADPGARWQGAADAEGRVAGPGPVSDGAWSAHAGGVLGHAVEHGDGAEASSYTLPWAADAAVRLVTPPLPRVVRGSYTPLSHDASPGYNAGLETRYAMPSEVPLPHQGHEGAGLESHPDPGAQWQDDAVVALVNARFGGSPVVISSRARHVAHWMQAPRPGQSAIASAASVTAGSNGVAPGLSQGVFTRSNSGGVFIGTPSAAVVRETVQTATGANMPGAASASPCAVPEPRARGGASPLHRSAMGVPSRIGSTQPVAAVASARGAVSDGASSATPHAPPTELIPEAPGTRSTVSLYMPDWADRHLRLAWVRLFKIVPGPFSCIAQHEPLTTDSRLGIAGSEHHAASDSRGPAMERIGGSNHHHHHAGSDSRGPAMDGGRSQLVIQPLVDWLSNWGRAPMRSLP